MAKGLDLESKIFDGLMLSDGHLKPITDKTNSVLTFCLKHKEFAQCIVDSLPFFSWSSIKTRNIFDKRTSKTYCQVNLRSHTNEFFTKERKRWYPDGIKIVPKDIKLNREVLLWWYLGDGSLTKYRAESYRNRPLQYMNDFRKKNKVRELKYINKDLILLSKER